MKHIYSIVALPVLVCGTVLAGSPQASARVIDPESGYRDNVVVVQGPGRTNRVQVDDNLADSLQTGAGALGGAGLAVAAMWLYRRRHPLAAH
jgi:hypothetical protein